MMARCSMAMLMVLAACGGTEPTGMAQGALEVAPLWMAEQDLPGCSCDSMPQGELRALLHPYDSGLVVATTKSGEPRCIDTEQLVLRLATDLGIHFNPGLLSDGMPAGDDPIPIGDGRRTGSEGEGEGEGEGGSSSGPPGSEQMVASGTGSDDPIPIGTSLHKKPLSTQPVRF